MIKVYTFSDFKNQVKSDIENFKYLFQIEDDGGIREKVTFYFYFTLFSISQSLNKYGIQNKTDYSSYWSSLVPH